jgi:hypothetical protein
MYLFFSCNSVWDFKSFVLIIMQIGHFEILLEVQTEVKKIAYCNLLSGFQHHLLLCKYDYTIVMLAYWPSGLIFITQHCIVST